MIREEVKKILNWKICLCLLAFGGLYFLLFLKPYVHTYEGSYQMSIATADSIVGQFGKSISEEEYEKMKKNSPDRDETKIDHMIAKNELFQSYGIHTFREFNKAEEGLSTDESTALWMEIYDEFTDEDVSEESIRSIKADLYDMYLESYRAEVLENVGSTSYYEKLDEKQRQRVIERSKEEVKEILPPLVISVNFEVLQYWSCFVILSVLFLILPYMVRENKNRMNMLQYSCRRGRKYYLYKMAACLISAFCVIVVEFLLYLMIAKVNCVTDFWNVQSSSFSSGYIGWFPWSLGKMTMMNVLFCVMAAFGAGMVLFIVSRYCRNYITAIACALPLIILSGLYGTFLTRHFMEITGGKYTVPMTAAAVLAIGILSAGVQFAMERRRDID